MIRHLLWWRRDKLRVDCHIDHAVRGLECLELKRVVCSSEIPSLNLIQLVWWKLDCDDLLWMWRLEEVGNELRCQICDGWTPDGYCGTDTEDAFLEPVVHRTQTKRLAQTVHALLVFRILAFTRNE